MPSYTRAVTGVAASSPILMDTFQGAGNVGIQVVVSGTVTYTVQHSQDNTRDANSLRQVPTTWFDDATLAAKSVNGETSFTVPIQWLRLNVTAGTGTATMTVTQAGPGR